MTEIATPSAARPSAPRRGACVRPGRARSRRRAGAASPTGAARCGAGGSGRRRAGSTGRRRRSAGSRPSSPPRSSGSGTAISPIAHAAGRHDLGDQLLVEHEVVGVEAVRDRLEQAPASRRGGPCGTRRGAARRRAFSTPVRKRLETNFQRGMPPASGSPRNRLPSIRSASPARIGATSCRDPRGVVLVVGVEHHDDVGAPLERRVVAGLLVAAVARFWRWTMTSRPSRWAISTVSSFDTSSTRMMWSTRSCGMSAYVRSSVRAALYAGMTMTTLRRPVGATGRAIHGSRSVAVAIRGSMRPTSRTGDGSQTDERRCRQRRRRPRMLDRLFGDRRADPAVARPRSRPAST